ncbi:MAG TPA: sulfur oxidation c-type cytochrome SoxX [Burkholderiales bacterium]|nr:sulfur oxidation c-type cytochrome SoxX [Burkholderiales bacterium]
MKSATRVIAGFAVLAGVVAGCASMSDQEASQRAIEVMKASFAERGQARLDRLDQDETQKLCSKPPAAELAKDLAERIEKTNLASIRYPADGTLLGDWKSGERIAQSGVGKQFSDDPKQPSGANCYACHQLSKAEISYGTIGPSLFNYGKLRGTSEAIQRYTYGKIYNAQAFTACSNMPRFGHNGILSEQQMKDVAALLLDPKSPVNQ